jgi:hypothetical protein
MPLLLQTTARPSLKEARLRRFFSQALACRRLPALEMSRASLSGRPAFLRRNACPGAWESVRPDSGIKPHYLNLNQIRNAQLIFYPY